MFSIDDVKVMNDGFKKERDDLTKKLEIATKKWVLMDDLSVAVEYLNQVLKLFDDFSNSDEKIVKLITKLYNMPLELTSLVMIPIEDIEEVKNRILDFAKSNIPGALKHVLVIQRMVTARELNNEFSDIVSNDDIFRKVSDIVYYLQVIQVWFACKYVILYEKNKAEEDLK